MRSLKDFYSQLRYIKLCDRIPSKHGSSQLSDLYSPMLLEPTVAFNRLFFLAELFIRYQVI